MNDFVIGTGRCPIIRYSINVTVGKLFSEEFNLTKHQNRALAFLSLLFSMFQRRNQ